MLDAQLESAVTTGGKPCQFVNIKRPYIEWKNLTVYRVNSSAFFKLSLLNNHLTIWAPLSGCLDVCSGFLSGCQDNSAVSEHFRQPFAVWISFARNLTSELHNRFQRIFSSDHKITCQPLCEVGRGVRKWVFPLSHGDFQCTVGCLVVRLHG